MDTRLNTWWGLMLLGALSALALPPLFAGPVLLLTLPALFRILAAQDHWWRAAWRGWCFGLGYFTAGLYWIANALLVDGSQFAWVVPLAVLGLPMLFSFYMAGMAALFSWTRGRHLLWRWFWFAALWTCFEILRGVLLTGFPWNLLGSALAFHPVLLQPASLVGAYGLSFVVVLVATLPLLWQAHRQEVYRALLVLLVVVFWGQWRLHQPVAAVENVRVRLVQANVPQSLKWDPQRRQEHFLKHLRLSKRAGQERVDAIIWPEAATPFFVLEDAAAQREIATMLAPSQLLLTGAPRVERSLQGTQLYNSLLAFATDGLIATYDKHHLVPFGEYVPLKKWLPFEKIVAGWMDYSSGPGPQTLFLPDLPPFSPLVCYEAIFPGAVVDERRAARWLLNVTNDGWYGISTGPYQHLHSARLRAVEEGLPLVRVANTGISAVVDARGRVVSSLPLGQTGILDADSPPPLKMRPLFARFKNFPLLVAFLAMGVIYVSSKRQ